MHILLEMLRVMHIKMDRKNGGKYSFSPQNGPFYLAPPSGVPIPKLWCKSMQPYKISYFEANVFLNHGKVKLR